MILLVQKLRQDTGVVGLGNMKIQDIITLSEALTKTQKRSLYSKLKDLKYNRHRWADIFDNKYRIYFNLSQPIETVKSPSKEILMMLDDYGYTTTNLDYREGYAYQEKTYNTTIDQVLKNQPELLQKYHQNKQQRDNDIVFLLRSYGYIIRDYNAGTVTKTQEVKRSIGSILNDLIRQGEISPQLKQIYDSDPFRTGVNIREPLIGVISRHPEDIAGMSTDRGWTSCMNLNTGTQSSYLPIDIAQGTIVAYLTTADDKNIENPRGRIAIKPFINIENQQVALGIQNKVYGTVSDEFLDKVRQWVDYTNRKRDLQGIFKISGHVYSDDPAHEYIEIGDESLSDIKSILRSNSYDILDLPEEYRTSKILAVLVSERPMQVRYLDRVINDPELYFRLYTIADQHDSGVLPDVSVDMIKQTPQKFLDLLKSHYENYASISIADIPEFGSNEDSQDLYTIVIKYAAELDYSIIKDVKDFKTLIYVMKLSNNPKVIFHCLVSIIEYTVSQHKINLAVQSFYQHYPDKTKAKKIIKDFVESETDMNFDWIFNNEK